MTSSSETISKGYRREQERLHADPKGYGLKGKKWADHVHTLATKYAANEILDYGCGRNTLCEELRNRGLRTRSYDPAIKAFSKRPKASDLVVCADVLEHVEPDRMEFVLSDLVQLTRIVGFFVVSTVETAKILSDGRQAHISLHAAEWWIAKISERFRIVERLTDPILKPEKQVIVIVVPK
jgi:2-polyprenyl-3-methyl-5-hydroxy-6-metoxy-1,4-benzoquinol methylase